MKSLAAIVVAVVAAVSVVAEAGDVSLPARSRPYDVKEGYGGRGQGYGGGHRGREHYDDHRGHEKYDDHHGHEGYDEHHDHEGYNDHHGHENYNDHHGHGGYGDRHHGPDRYGGGGYKNHHHVQYDAIVVGGGPAGLAALSGLARVRRHVLMIDSGVYRNGRTQHMHDVLGFDGVTPAYFRWAARKQLAFYKTVSWTNGTVTSIKAYKAEGETRFKVYSAHRGKRYTYTARKVILGTGLRDILPSTPGIYENWGNGIFWCPWCDGFEHADQKMGILKTLAGAIGTVRTLRTLNHDMIIFTNGTDTAHARASLEKTSPGWEVYLKKLYVRIDNRRIKSIVKVRGPRHDEGDPSLPSHPMDNVFRVNFFHGPPVIRNGFVLDEVPVQASKVGERMGVQLFGGRLGINFANMETNVPGVYAIGDANSDNSTNVPHAFWSGKRSAVSAHGAIGREDYSRDVGDRRRKRAVLETERTIWARMNDAVEDMLYAGEFDRFSR